MAVPQEPAAAQLEALANHHHQPSASRSAATRGRAETNQQEQLNEGIQCFMCFLNLARFVFAFSLHRNLILRVSSVFLVFVRLVCSLGILFFGCTFERLCRV